MGRCVHSLVLLDPAEPFRQRNRFFGDYAFKSAGLAALSSPIRSRCRRFRWNCDRYHRRSSTNPENPIRRNRPRAGSTRSCSRARIHLAGRSASPPKSRAYCKSIRYRWHRRSGSLRSRNHLDAHSQRLQFGHLPRKSPWQRGLSYEPSRR